MNQQQIIGFLGKDPEEKIFGNGDKGARFTVAVRENGYTTSSGREVPEHTEWFNVVLKGKLAETALQYLHKGDRVFLEGKTWTNERVDERTGAKRRYTEVICDKMEMLGKPQPTTDNGQQKQGNALETQRAQQPQQEHAQQSFGTQEVLPF